MVSNCSGIIKSVSFRWIQQMVRIMRCFLDTSVRLIILHLYSYTKAHSANVSETDSPNNITNVKNDNCTISMGGREMKSMTLKNCFGKFRVWLVYWLSFLRSELPERQSTSEDFFFKYITRTGKNLEYVLYSFLRYSQSRRVLNCSFLSTFRFRWGLQRKLSRVDLHNM